VKWRKQPGDKVAMGDVVAEVETDKATMEMESFEDGIIHELLVQVGQKVPIGSRIAMVLSKGEKPPAPGSVPSPASSVKNAAPTAPTSAAACATGHAVSGSPEVTHLALGTRLKSSPLARKLAKERGANLASLQGTGPGGRIIAKDVLQAKSGVQTVVAPVVQSVAPASVPVLAAGAGDQVIPLSGMRRIIAERLLLSKTTIPHFYLHIEVDAAPMMKMRAELNAGVDPEKGIKLTVNDFVLKAVVAAAVMWHYREPLQQLVMLPLAAAIAQTAHVAGMSFLIIAGTLALVAAVDVPFQLWKHGDDLKMSREELRQEHKESEGNPQIKAAIRQQQREMARRRMMTEVPKASVIVTNPTHYAVALSYEDRTMRAPRVVAKGADLIAAKIRELGAQHNVPVLESPALARAIYAHAEIGEEIPETLYTAVAEILAYVFQLRRHREYGDATPLPLGAVAVPAGLDPQGALQ